MEKASSRDPGLPSSSDRQLKMPFQGLGCLRCRSYWMTAGLCRIVGMVDELRKMFVWALNNPWLKSLTSNVQIIGPDSRSDAQGEASGFTGSHSCQGCQMFVSEEMCHLSSWHLRRVMLLAGQVLHRFFFEHDGTLDWLIPSGSR